LSLLSLFQRETSRKKEKGNSVKQYRLKDRASPWEENEEFGFVQRDSSVFLGFLCVRFS